MENCPPEKAPLEERCYEDGSCKDESCQDQIVARHQITETCFQAMVSAFADPIPEGRKYYRYEITALLLLLDCTKGQYIQFEGKDSQLNNNDIKLAPIYLPLSGRYSVAFFKGLIRIYKADLNDEFLFYKAIDLNTKKVTLAMLLRVDGTDVYYGDLVGLYP